MLLNAHGGPLGHQEGAESLLPGPTVLYQAGDSPDKCSLGNPQDFSLRGLV